MIQLPFDVQLTILDFLEPLDVLRVRTTCKALHRTTSERIIWIKALRRACVRNNIFMPTFPIHDMSVEALEYAATGPERFLRTAAKDELYPCTHRVIECDIFREIYFVPGGRYLIIVDCSRLAVWDLGIPGCASTPSQNIGPICSLPTPLDYHVLSLAVRPTEDGRGLTMLANYDNEDLETTRFVVYQIYPGDEFPILREVAEVDALRPAECWFCSLSNTKVVYLLDSALNVWDYVEDAWTSIEVETDYRQLIVSKLALLLIYDDRVLIWQIPRLPTSQSMFSGMTSLNIPPAFTLNIPNNGMVRHCRAPCAWDSDTSKPLLFDFRHDNQFQRFEIVHKNENFNDAVILSLGKYPDNSKRVPESWQFCNDMVVCSSVIDDEGLTVADIRRLPAAADTPDMHSSPDLPMVVLYQVILGFNYSEKLYVRSFVCPFSGRFAYFDDCNSAEVKVLDYFSDSFPEKGCPDGG